MLIATTFMSSDTANLTNFAPPAFANAKSGETLLKFPQRKTRERPEEAGTALSTLTGIRERTEKIYKTGLDTVRRDTDRGFMYLMAFQWVFGIAIAGLISPLTWSGAMAAVHIHVFSAIFLGGLIISLPLWLAYTQPGAPLTRQTVAIAQMLYGGLLIHLTGGRIETHFHIFGSLAFLAFYRDWRVIVTASLVVALDHVARGLFWPMSVFGVGESVLPGGVAFTTVSRVLEHVGWVVFESFFLVLAINRSLQEMHTAALTTAENEALSDDELYRAQTQADTILRSVDEGLFLMDENYRIGAKHSAALPRMLGQERLSGASLLDLLRGHVTERNYLNAVQFLKLMFDPRKKEKQILRVNPLQNVELSLERSNGTFETRHLDFRFSRIMEAGEVAQLLVTVADVTDRVLLEQQLKESERTKDRQLSMLLNILHVEPSLLREFIEAANGILQQLNGALKEVTDSNHRGDAQRQVQLRSKLEVIGRLMHQFKGNAALLDLEYFVHRAHELEENVVELRQRSLLSGADFLPLVMKQSDLELALAETRGLLERMAGLRHALPLEAIAHSKTGMGAQAASQATEEPTVGSLSGALADYVSRTSERLAKPAELDVREFQEATIPARYRGLLRDVLTHFANNALVHGLESGPVREMKGKPPLGRLILRTMETDPATFQFSFSDDGQGLQASKLRKRAIEMGLASPEQISAWPGHKLVELIFEPGFSTVDRATTEAGRGLGMNVVKDRVVNEFGGEIRVSSVPGSGCSFHIVLPAS